METVDVTLPSGSTLKITPGSFEEAQALYEALLEDGKTIRVEGRDEIFNLLKDVFCTAFASPRVKAAMRPLLARCLYNGAKIGKDTWEERQAREDYYDALVEVAQVNINPFVKGLYARFSPLLERARSFLG